MAYVGLGPIRVDLQNTSKGALYLVGYATKLWDNIADYDGATGNSPSNDYAIDVRTEWAQEHFPEHCRIRNYQEPARYGYFKGELIIAPEGWELVPEGEELASEIWYVTDYEDAKFLAINRSKKNRPQIAKVTLCVIGYFRKIQEPDPKHDAWVNFATNHPFDVGDHDSFKSGWEAAMAHNKNPQPTK
jgi:hypothetical protein